jgi:tetratricopeptide (TPR) repeat protein
MPHAVQESYPPHLLAQKLNNRGSILVEQGLYQEAIATYVKALKLSENSANYVSCPCRCCSLGLCLSMATCSTRREHVAVSSASDMHKKLPSLQDFDPMEVEELEELGYEGPSMNDARLTSCQDSNEDLSSTSGGYVYTNALQVCPESILLGHNMGVTLSLIIIFNLALAHHLMGIHGPTTATNQEADTKLLTKALQLYELAYQLHVDEAQAAAAAVPPCTLHHHVQEEEEEYLEDADSRRMAMLRFTMIVSNNLGEIHRVARNPYKHQLCLQHLLSTIMYMVDGHFLSQHGPPSNATSLNNATSSMASTHRTLSEEELDGFLRNTSVLMLHDNCAAAA